MANDVAADVLQAELERSRALSDRNVAELDKFLAEDYVHTYLTGRVHDKDQHLAWVKERGRRIIRRDLSVRVYGNVAIMTGILQPDDEGDPNSARITQVWKRAKDAWHLVAFHASRINE